MKDISGLMKQAQGMQAKLAEAQGKVAALSVEGRAGGGLVVLTLTGAGELTGVTIADDLLQPGEGETLSDLIRAAHTDARARIEAESARLMKEAMGPLAHLAGAIPGLKI